MAFEPSSETRAYIDGLIPKYPQSRSALLMILHAVQKEQGFLSLEAQEWIAGRLELTPQQVREVVTFYPFYREHPIGKRHIRVCRTLSCALNGSYAVCDKLCEAFETERDAVSPDGRVTIEFAECLASCGTAPVVMVDDDLLENVTPDKVEALVEKLKAETPATTSAPAS
ncbi:MAG: NADH-quinone oxidoreductase subunit NuoE [Opitutales bacterium]